MQVYIDNHRNKRINGIRQALINLKDWDSLDIPYCIPNSGFVEPIGPPDETGWHKVGCLG
jgi:hypothetical protein